MKPLRILVSLDLILDTRMGTIRKHYGEEVAIEVFENGYVDRFEDVFSRYSPKIDDTQYAEFYAKRDVETLAASIITCFTMKLPDITHRMEIDTVDLPIHNSTNVTINTFPYSLTKPEQDMLAQMLLAHVSPSTSITLEYIPYNELTPTMIKEHFVACYFYSLQDWLPLWISENKSPMELEMAKMPGIEVMTPAIATNGALDLSKCSLPGYGKYDPFDMLKISLVEYCNYNAMDSWMGNLYHLRNAESPSKDHDLFRVSENIVDKKSGGIHEGS